MTRKTMLLGWIAACSFAFGISDARAQHDHSGHDHDGHNHAEQEAKEGPLCPIMGEPVNLSISSATDDGPVFFCCPMCVEKYESAPEKYAKKVAEQRKALASRAKVQVKCPVEGKPANKKVSVEHDGQKIYFCSDDCAGKFTKEPAKYAKGLANSYTYQTHCPVMGGKINPQAFSVLPTGETIYYCCMACDSKLLGNPKKYAPKLAAQGIKLNVARLEKALKGE